MAIISVSERKIEKQKGVVILPLREYQKLCEKAVPTYYLTGREAEELDKLVREGLKEYKEGKTIKASSLTRALAKGEDGRRNKFLLPSRLRLDERSSSTKEALKIHGRKKNKKS